ncbi:hypothetical protein [Alkalibaculum bacchi]|uniref:hypothetical protein n=1 Tax=Alkalibaculum bacchi TaxID=645887 RepID=UPI0026EC8D33|nr:hypothetical protein [Alkalibaculum bacchi]
MTVSSLSKLHFNNGDTVNRKGQKILGSLQCSLKRVPNEIQSNLVEEQSRFQTYIITLIDPIGQNL